MKIALAQFSVERGSVDTNLKTINAFIEESAAADASILFLPEMCTTGFDWTKNKDLLDGAADLIRSLQATAQAVGIAVSGSFLEKTESGNAANTLYYIEKDGSIAAKYRKAHLFTLFREDVHVEAGDEIVVADTQSGKIGCSVCYD
ncbi:MAG: hypothetical protein NWR36_04400, partial [Opitutales bacterium]|nr:hypothetical protein [Opitutales bacterium]